MTVAPRPPWACNAPCPCAHLSRLPNGAECRPLHQKAESHKGAANGLEKAVKSPLLGGSAYMVADCLCAFASSGWQALDIATENDRHVPTLLAARPVDTQAHQSSWRASTLAQWHISGDRPPAQLSYWPTQTRLHGATAILRPFSAPGNYSVSLKLHPSVQCPPSRHHVAGATSLSYWLASRVWPAGG